MAEGRGRLAVGAIDPVLAQRLGGRFRRSRTARHLARAARRCSVEREGPVGPARDDQRQEQVGREGEEPQPHGDSPQVHPPSPGSARGSGCGASRVFHEHSWLVATLTRAQPHGRAGTSAGAAGHLPTLTRPSTQAERDSQPDQALSARMMPGDSRAGKTPAGAGDHSVKVTGWHETRGKMTKLARCAGFPFLTGCGLMVAGRLAKSEGLGACRVRPSPTTIAESTGSRRVFRATTQLRLTNFTRSGSVRVPDSDASPSRGFHASPLARHATNHDAFDGLASLCHPPDTPGCEGLTSRDGWRHLRCFGPFR